MDIFFTDPNDLPVSPEDVRIREFELKPYPDGRRLAARFAISPFQERPNIEINIFNQDNQVIADLSVVEVIEARMTFTLHLPAMEYPQTIKGEMILFYNDLEGFDESLENLPTATEFLSRSKQIIDHKEFTIKITTERNE